MQLESVLTWAVIGLALAIAIVVLIIRRITEFAFPAVSKNTPPTRIQQFWERIALPTLPSILCAAFCWIVPPSDFHYPTIAQSLQSRIVCGIVVGWFASWGYSIITFLIFKKWNVASPLQSLPPDKTPESIKVVVVPASDPTPKETPAAEPPTS